MTWSSIKSHWLFVTSHSTFTVRAGLSFNTYISCHITVIDCLQTMGILLYILVAKLFMGAIMGAVFVRRNAHNEFNSGPTAVASPIVWQVHSSCSRYFKADVNFIVFRSQCTIAHNWWLFDFVQLHELLNIFIYSIQFLSFS